MKRLVSAILTVYNEEKLLKESLDSLVSQTYKPLEIIVIDDGSTDRSVKIAEKCDVKLVKQPHLGLGAARNRGAREAKGEIIVFCDGDLVYSQNYIAKLVEPILKGKTIGTFHKDELVKNPDNLWSRCWQINDHLPLERKIPEDVADKGIFFRAILKEKFLAVRGFDEIGYLDDRTLFPKLKKKALGVSGAICWHYNPASLVEVFVDARWHGKSLAKNNAWQAILQYFPLSTLRRVVIDTISSGEPFYFLFKIVYDGGTLLGIFEYFLSKDLAK